MLGGHPISQVERWPPPLPYGTPRKAAECYTTNIMFSLCVQGLELKTFQQGCMLSVDSKPNSHNIDSPGIGSHGSSQAQDKVLETDLLT